ncbi:hypothetical protein [Desulfosarcina ovata]|uniref:Lipoprotein n=2 Tax=Desulfosarcina ovata TaxID=83564 RepID=A0A5K8AGH3_9BACT|nr:hypothetical protein [Desulfosarcina ovata]BBO84436.1 hypothetical protein DSCO28_50020 [Desulfosarcina ovata subsp. sediminis]BBO90950.1 hypothetical protein DSCOOX_41300 [Desulfosarcina ovata subsp. ovata]
MRVEPKKIFLAGMLLLLMGCNDEKRDFDISDVQNPYMKISHATIDTCEYVSGQLRINGTCSDEGDILMVLPLTPGDKRIIGAPRCSHSRYELLTATFGRPPCKVSLEFGGDQSIQAKVAGTDMYCP